MSNTFQAIPTNLVTGFLGSGKTTLILNLLKSRPQNERWAVLVNEFGDVGIDGSMLKQQGSEDTIFIKEVPGGCICCAAGLPLQMALNLLIKQARPHRILIEPTGVGHPRKVLETLTGEFYQNVLELRATLCLVEAKNLLDERFYENETFQDQINMADVLLASKADLSTENELAEFKKLCDTFSIRKAHCQSMNFGQLALSVLDIERNESRSCDFPEAHEHHGQTQSSGSVTTVSVPNMLTNENSMNCDWRRFENSGNNYYGCGWIFNKSIVFDEDKLNELLKDKDLSRIKGIFHTLQGWWIFNRSEAEFSKEESSHRTDSRVEIIEPDRHDWNMIEERLLACIDHYLDS